LSFHLQGRVEELVAQGMPRDEAEREALRRFGDRARVEADLERMDAAAVDRLRARERWGAMVRDVRYAVRGLVRRPLFAATVVITLALAIGANTAVFSVLEAVLLRPYPIHDIGRLAVVHDDFPRMNLRNAGISAPEALDLFKRTDLFATATARGAEVSVVDVHGVAARVSGSTTLGNYFSLFELTPLYGRVYAPDDSRAGSPAVVVLSYELWHRISGDSTIIGRTIDLTGKPYEVVGIMRPGTGIPRFAQYWRPLVLDSLALDNEKSRGTLTQLFVGRVRDGVSYDRLTAALRGLAAQWHQEYTSNYQRGGHTMTVEPLVDVEAGELKPIVLALYAAVVFVLLIACANVASLQLVRSISRAREFAVRTALGAGRGAIVRQLLVESTLLTLVGGVAGIAVGRGALFWLTHLNIARFPALANATLDGPVLGFTAGAAVVAAIIVGTAPAWRAVRTDVNAVLRSAGRGASDRAGRNRFLQASVVTQNALVLVLLSGAALTIRSLDRLLSVDPGFNADRVLAFGISLPSQSYPTAEQRLSFFRTLDERLRAIPGVQSVGFAAGVPFMGGAGSTPYKLPSIPDQPGEPQRHADQAFVYGRFFETMGIQIARGHAFTDAEYTSGPPVMIVDENLVRQSFGAADPIGVPIEHGMQGVIVGVARRVKLSSLTDVDHPLVYHDFGHASYITGLTAVVRSTLPADQIVKATRAAVASLDQGIPVSPRMLQDQVTNSVAPRRLATQVLAAFAALALVLATLGIYSVMSYVVGQRTKEIGIRVALGAQRFTIAGIVVRDGMWLAGAGLGVGAVAYVAGGKLVRSLLYGVGPFDAVSLGAAAALLGAVTVVACWIPARRAARVDPAVTLRSE
jgi:putative ABC transport system permease protein